MAIVLNPATEQRIQRELERGLCETPDQVISRALDLLESEREWVEIDKDTLHARLAESIAQIQRGEGIPGERLLEELAARRSANPT